MTRKHEDSRPAGRGGSAQAKKDWPLPTDYPNIVSFAQVLGEEAETVSAGDAQETPPAEDESEPSSEEP